MIMRTASLLLFCLSVSGIAGLAERSPVRTDALARVMVLDEGRKKPLDTYARSLLVRFSGRKTYEGRSAIEWLSGALFRPEQAMDTRIFLINNPEIADAIGIAPEKRRRYSYAQLEKGYEVFAKLARKSSMTEPKDRSAFENDLLRTNENLNAYAELLSAFTLFEQSQTFDVRDSALAAFLEMDSAQQYASYWDLLMRSSRLSRAMQEIQARKAEGWSHLDTEVIGIAHAMYRMAGDVENPPVHIIPFSDSSGETWLSPWGMAARLGQKAVGKPEMRLVREIWQTFRQGDQAGFDASVRQFCALVKNGAGGTASIADPGIELLYNRIDPFSRAKIIYGIALLCALISLAVQRRRLTIAGTVAVVAGVLLQIFGIILRMIILHRSPVANLYETFVFTALCCVGLGLFIGFLQRSTIGLFIASLGGFLLLHLAGRYDADGDTMGMLTAVLNSNFWLSTHIMTVTLGYAGCGAAGIAGHLYCIHAIFAPGKNVTSEQHYRALYGLLAFGLIFTTIGTVLGGMWAEQAWGRFWGWDPKENGALLIILWCAMLFHAKAGRLIGEFGMAVGTIIGLMLIMFAWLGVNLLGVGLHSYGFTSSGAAIMFGFIGVETLFLITAITLMIIRKQRAAMEIKS
jgi:ABC-type transport system involved in cytochrome c biogenesis permease subunit